MWNVLVQQLLTFQQWKPSWWHHSGKWFIRAVGFHLSTPHSTPYLFWWGLQVLFRIQLLNSPQLSSAQGFLFCGQETSLWGILGAFVLEFLHCTYHLAFKGHTLMGLALLFSLKAAFICPLRTRPDIARVCSRVEQEAVVILWFFRPNRGPFHVPIKPTNLVFPGFSDRALWCFHCTNFETRSTQVTMLRRRYSTVVKIQ